MIPLAFGTPGPVELGLIFAIVLLVFGAGKLPKVAGQMGDAIRSFKKGVAGANKEVEEAKEAIEAPAPEADQEVEVEVGSEHEERE